MKQNVKGNIEREDGTVLASFDGWIEPKPHGGMTMWHGAGEASKPLMDLIQPLYLHLDDGRKAPIIVRVDVNWEASTKKTTTTVSFKVASGSL